MGDWQVRSVYPPDSSVKTVQCEPALLRHGVYPQCQVSYDGVRSKPGYATHLVFYQLHSLIHLKVYTPPNHQREGSRLSVDVERIHKGSPESGPC